ncbi:hypothetical protein J7547_07290 [Wohlfahrtiimonas chitiniclastica]|uniref:Phospholipase D-like domain-containing protein n=1 Tax=Wohlfahrtiimonas chitiniclastica TaxID=400946 RepID=A0AB35C0F1_9GAMM|nr:hypothetical protein [Wohlfahrtiimonas chitiniclastica]MBS7825020.1 hypothetical protein [Wohlfahrtiimonas chitiniclastica]MBS7840625.1 hypothetical protein [Wohlfahrtiimonas chitiniclastica]
MFNNTQRSHKGKCPTCQNIIEYQTIKFIAENDIGEMICICSNCNESFKISTKNPRESTVISGAIKQQYIDYEINEPSTHPSISEEIQFEGSLFYQEKKYNYQSNPLYICSCNHNTNLEEIAYMALNKSESEWKSILGRYTNAYLAGQAKLIENVIIQCNINCSFCNREHNAFFYKLYKDVDAFLPSQFMLGSISNSLELDIHLSGVLSKNDFMCYLIKLLSRWEMLFDQYYLIFPYIGSTYTKAQDILEIWTKILSQIQNSKKAHIKSIGQTFKSQSQKQFDSVYGENAYSFLKEYGLTPIEIDQNQGLQHFHAKIYCALRNDKIELYSGSANLMHGPSLEQMTMTIHTKNLDNVYQKYLSHFKITKDEAFDTPYPEYHSHLIIQQCAPSFSYRYITQSDLISLVES